MPRTITGIKEEIAEIKVANPGWRTDAGDKYVIIDFNS